MVVQFLFTTGAFSSTLNAVGEIKTTSNQFTVQPATSTQGGFTQIVNTNGTAYFGKEGATPGILSGSTAYALIINSLGSTAPMQFGTNNTVRLTIDGSTGAVTATSSVQSTLLKLPNTGGAATSGNNA